MAKFKLKRKGSMSKKVQTEMNRAIRDSGILNEIAEGIIADMRSGENPRTGRPFKQLSPGTIDQRKRLARYNETGEGFSPGRSNLTFSGQLLESIKAKIFITKSRIEIEPKGSRKRYKKKGGGLSKTSPPTNKKLASYHDKGLGSLPKRQIITFSKKRVREIASIIRSAIIRRFN